ncbi:UNVERIFIED_CONTAM: hypothetical protein FKN15_051617 [Acipenser sinensis]
MFEEVTTALKINKPMLEAAVRLRDSGFKTCVLTNTWVDDSAQREGTAQALSSLSGHFNLLIESCRAGMRKPDPAFYSLALDKLNAKPQEAIFLDDIGANLKVAREMGMATILVGDTTEALKELQTLSGVQLLGCEEFMPSYCRPTDVAHGFVSIKGIPQVTLIGHDWGGSVVWNMAQCYPERVRAVASLNTPLFPAKPDVNPMERIKSVPIFDYQLYFQKPVSGTSLTTLAI